jgi:cell shape-determining protein MreC
MRARTRLPSKATLFAVLMALAAILALLPARWTSWSRGLVQVLGLSQWAVSAAARAVVPDARPASPHTPELDALRRQVAHQAVELRELRARLEEVSGLQNQLRDPRTQILIAPVLGYDAAPHRQTLLLGRGAAAGVRVGQWVAAGAGRGAAGASGRELLGRQWLIGRVAEAQPHVCRVLLASDPDFKVPVMLVRLRPDGVAEVAPGGCVLEGRGRGQMRISQAPGDYSKQGYTIVVAGSAGGLPAPLSIGQVVSSAPMEESALHFNLEVAPWSAARDLGHAYVILTGL